MNKLKTIIAEEYKTLSDSLDRQYNFFKSLREFKEKNGFIPAEHMKAWDRFITRDGGLLWNEQRKARKIVMKAAKLHALRKLNEK